MSQTLLENPSNQTEQLDPAQDATGAPFELTELPNPAYDETIRDMDDDEAAKKIQQGRTQAFEEAYAKDDTDLADEAAFTSFMNVGFSENDKVSVKEFGGDKNPLDIESKINIPPTAEAVGDMAVSSQVEKEQV